MSKEKENSNKNVKQTENNNLAFSKITHIKGSKTGKDVRDEKK